MRPGVIFRRKESVADRRIAGESFLIPVCGAPVDMENIFVLNPLGDFIWKRLDGKRTLAAIVADIVAEFDVEVGQADADFNEFVAQLADRGLVEEVE